MKPTTKMYCFTIDDNIRFFEEACKSNFVSVFDTPYLRMLRGLHTDFDCKVQLNMFYSYRPGSFSLSDCPDCYRSDFERNSDWLKLSFHARHNEPEYPYADKDGELQRDYTDMMRELNRIAGPDALGETTTLHYVTCTKEAGDWLAREGVKALIGMFLDLPGREALRYYLTPDEANLVRRDRIWRDPQTNLTFFKNHLVVNQLSLSEINSICDDGSLAESELFQFMIHEQYFYSDYVDYQPDFEMKLRTVLEWCIRNGYRSYFLEEMLTP